MKNFNETQEKCLKDIQKAIQTLHESNEEFEIKFKIDFWEFLENETEKVSRNIYHEYKTNSENKLVFVMEKSLSNLIL
jgi:hypothetical protein